MFWKQKNLNVEEKVNIIKLHKKEELGVLCTLVSRFQVGKTDE